MHVPSVLTWAVLWCALVWTEPAVYIYVGDMTLGLPHHYELAQQSRVSAEASCYQTCPAHRVWGLEDWAPLGEALPVASMGLVPCAFYSKQLLMLLDSSLGSDGDSACPLKERTKGKLI